MQAISVLSLLGLTLAGVPTPPPPPLPFENDLTEPINFECDQGYGMYRVVSNFGEASTAGRRKRTSGNADRQWGFGCQKVNNIIICMHQLLSSSNVVCSYSAFKTQRICMPL